MLASKLRGLLLVGTCAAMLTAAESARADDEDDLEQILGENVVSGASKSDEVASDAPATMTTITAADMRRYGIRSIAEAINFLGMGLVTQDPLHSVEVGGRGVLLTSDFGNHVLLVVDGHVFNEPWDGTAYFEQGAAVPIELIDHIELVLGPGSVLYGGNAMFGVVNVVTKRATSYAGLHFVGEVGASPEQGRNGELTSFALGDLGTSYRLGTGIGHTLTLFGKPAEITAQAELYRQDGPSFQWGPQPANNADGTPTNLGPRAPLGVWTGRTVNQYTTTVPSVYARLVVGDFTVSARAATYERRTPYLNGLNQSLSDFDEPRSFELDRWASLDVQHRGRVGSKLTTLVHAYADVYDYKQELYTSQGDLCSTATSGPCLEVTRGRSRWLGTELQAQYDWRGDEKLTTMLGVDGRIRQIGASTDSLEAATNQSAGVVGANEVTEAVWAAYLQQRYSPLSVLHLNAGARFDADPRGGDRISPRVAAVFNPWKGGVVKAIYSEAFRAPTFYEAYFQAVDQHAAPDLKAEVVRSAETSLEQKAGRHAFLMGVFRTWWSDMIALRALPDGFYQYENTSSVDNYGYNARAEGAFGDLRYGLSVTGAHTRRTTPEGGEPLPVAPQVFGNARVAYDLPGDLPTLALATTFVGRRPADRVNDGNFAAPPYAPQELQLRTTISGRVPGVPGLSYRLSANYVTVARSPYVAGPVQRVEATAPPTYAELAPVNRFTTFLTLRYDLPL